MAPIRNLMLGNLRLTLPNFTHIKAFPCHFHTLKGGGVYIIIDHCSLRTPIPKMNITVSVANTITFMHINIYQHVDWTGYIDNHIYCYRLGMALVIS